MGASDMSSPRVLIWRDRWLPTTQTFVRDQVEAYESWSPVTFGVVRTDQRLSDPDLHLVDESVVRVVRFLPRPYTVRRAVSSIARADVALIHAHFGPDGISALPVAQRLAVPLAVTFHGYDVTAFARRHLGEAYRARLRTLFAGADMLIGVSQYIAERLLSLGAPPAKVVVHRHGVPVPELPGPPALDGGLVFIGRLSEKKGLDDLVSAMALLPEPWRSTPLTVFGDGPLRAGLEAGARAHGVVVDFRGHRPHAEVAEAMSRAAVVCAPSKTGPDGDTEGLPTVLVEAAMRGIPVVTTHHAGNPEALVPGATGLVVPESDPVALAQALSRLLADGTLRARMSRAALEFARENFDIRCQTRLLERRYDELVAVPSRAATQ